jgi:hypothetical protein
LTEILVFSRGAQCIKSPDEGSNSFEGSSENFETPIFVKDRENFNIKTNVRIIYFCPDFLQN